MIEDPAIFEAPEIDEDGIPSSSPRREGARRWGPTISLRMMRAEHRTLNDEERFILAVHERPTDRRDCRPEGVYRDDAGHLRPTPRGRLRIWPDNQPCPWVGCRHHLALAINSETHGMKELGDWRDGQPSCSLDIADAGDVTLDRAGDLSGITRERVRQIEVRALTRLKIAGVELQHRDVMADDEG